MWWLIVLGILFVFAVLVSMMDRKKKAEAQRHRQEELEKQHAREAEIATEKEAQVRYEREQTKEREKRAQAVWEEVRGTGKTWGEMSTRPSISAVSCPRCGSRNIEAAYQNRKRCRDCHKIFT